MGLRPEDLRISRARARDLQADHFAEEILEIADDGPEDLADAVCGARAMGFAGFNCTIPHKVAVIDHLDGLGESASLMGAVNCVVRRDGQFIGENTDGKGFVASLRRAEAQAAGWRRSPRRPPTSTSTAPSTRSSVSAATRPLLRTPSEPTR